MTISTFYCTSDGFNERSKTFPQFVPSKDWNVFYYYGPPDQVDYSLVDIYYLHADLI